MSDHGNIEFNVTIDSGNQAIVDDPAHAIITALQNIIKSIEHGNDCGAVMDYNGNSVGSWYLTNNQ